LLCPKFLYKNEKRHVSVIRILLVIIPHPVKKGEWDPRGHVPNPHYMKKLSFIKCHQPAYQMIGNFLLIKNYNRSKVRKTSLRGKILILNILLLRRCILN